MLGVSTGCRVMSVAEGWRSIFICDATPQGSSRTAPHPSTKGVVIYSPSGKSRIPRNTGNLQVAWLGASTRTKEADNE